MIDWTRIKNFYIATGFTDMRKQIDGLVAIIQLHFGVDPDEESLFLFCGRHSDRIKAIYWDGTGYILLYKRLSANNKFQWPSNKDELRCITQQQYKWLLEGLSIEQKKVIKKGPVETLF